MREISGSYYQNFGYKKFKVKIPASWQELDPSSFARIIEMTTYQKADRFVMSVGLLAILFGPKNFHILKNLGEELLTELVPLTNFIFQEQPPAGNKFPELQISKHEKWLAPAEDLSNIVFGEWCFAHQYFIYYKMTGDQAWLDLLLATIYRPAAPDKTITDPHYDGDLRQRFNENLIMTRKDQVSKLPAHIKLAASTWFTIAVNNLCAQRPHVFPKPPEVDPDHLAEPKPQDDSFNWMTIFRELLGPKWGTTEKLKHTNAMFVLDELEDRHIAFLEAKAQN